MDWKLIVSWTYVLLLLFLYVHGILGKHIPSCSLAVIQKKCYLGSHVEGSQSCLSESVS